MAAERWASLLYPLGWLPKVISTHLAHCPLPPCLGYEVSMCASASPLDSELTQCALYCFHLKESFYLLIICREVPYLFSPCDASFPDICITKEISIVKIIWVAFRQMCTLHLKASPSPESHYLSLILNILTWTMGILLLLHGVVQRMGWDNVCKPPSFCASQCVCAHHLMQRMIHKKEMKWPLFSLLLVLTSQRFLAWAWCKGILIPGTQKS